VTRGAQRLLNDAAVALVESEREASLAPAPGAQQQQQAETTVVNAKELQVLKDGLQKLEKQFEKATKDEKKRSEEQKKKDKAAKKEQKKKDKAAKKAVEKAAKKAAKEAKKKLKKKNEEKEGLGLRPGALSALTRLLSGGAETKAEGWHRLCGPFVTAVCGSGR
jgi:hypothetical protein